MTYLLDPHSAGLQRAADLLTRGEQVAFATETVYGLGADARNDRAVAGIYEAKGRPSFNPLIVHVSSLEAARIYVEWPDMANAVAQAFWPGPLTLVLPLRKGAGISKLVTAGLDSLAIRIPAHPMAQKLLAIFDGPVAAPSANPSGRISPTTAQHVLDGLGGKIAAVLEGGSCAVGLESTILDLTEPEHPKLLRAGGVTAEALGSSLGQSIALAHSDTPGKVTAPGQLTSHYAPRASVRLNASNWDLGELRLGFGKMDCDLNLSPNGDLLEAAANLFAHLHQLDAAGRPIAVSPIPKDGLGLAINDRLQRAAAPR